MQKGILLFHAHPDNMGDMLMLHAAVRRLSAASKGRVIVRSGYDPDSLAGLEGLLDIIDGEQRLPHALRAVRRIKRLFGPGNPAVRVRRLGRPEAAPEVVEIAAALDLCGFIFGDQWGADVAIHFGLKFQELRHFDIPIIKLPASFGPFQDPDTRESCSAALSHLSFICARDPESLEHLQSLGYGDISEFHPDFTGEVTCDDDAAARIGKDRVVIIPNARMVDKNGFPASNYSYTHYLQQLQKACQESLNLNPLFLFHDIKGDVSYFYESGLAGNPDVETFHSKNPLILKSAISKAKAVISSRYHGAANALSQGIPCVGTSWSHKYLHLFQEYGCAECLIPPDSPDPVAAVMHVLHRILRKNDNSISGGPRELHAGKTDLMWKSVLSRLPAPWSGRPC